MTKLAAIILTKNEERHMDACLDSLAWADRRVVFDSFSTDRTCDIARERGAEVLQHPFSDYAAQRNAALQAVDAAWIFFVDADERATPELAVEIGQIVGVEASTDPAKASTPDMKAEIVGWHVPRHNYLFGKLTRGAGYWPDYQMRLLKRGCAQYDRPASEIVKLEGPAGYLQNALLHYNYDTIAQFRQKQTFRIDFEAANLYRRGEKCRFYSPYYMTVRHFWWRYVTLKGYRDGRHGLRLCLLLAYYFGYHYYKRLGQLYRSGGPSAPGASRN
ncbi:(heptosyl)LPS beta-1,4-glucosyltransferase [Thermoflexales bacterium]|nr:(heptosyl)LPS beta-1,4-glucosyltransferase [Thermoflexales bacterium]